MLHELFHVDNENGSEEKPPGIVRSFTHAMKTQPIKIRLNLLSQHHSLWAHCLWNASVAIADMLETVFFPQCNGKRVLELGCGAGLPSLVAHQLGARDVLLTEYPEEILLNVVNQNILMNSNEKLSSIKASGLRWGDRQETSKIRLAYPNGFDLIILSDLIFNHSQHIPLLATASALLNEENHAAIVLVAFSHHRPHKMKEDLEFFTLAARGRTQAEACPDSPFPSLFFPPFFVTEMDGIMMQPMFEDDPGDPIIRSKIHVYTLKLAR